MLASESPPGPAEDPVLAKARKEYRMSLWLLAAGAILVVAVLLFEDWAVPTGVVSPGGAGMLWGNALGTGGFLLLILAGTIAVQHRAFLRREARNLRPSATQR